MTGIVGAAMGHLVGDYLLQNDWMAQNKKSDTLICAVHCAIWTLAVVVLSGWWIWWVPIVLFLAHFAQDRTKIVEKYMWAVGQRDFSKPPMAPWSIFVVDNTMHLLVIFLLWRFFI